MYRCCDWRSSDGDLTPYSKLEKVDEETFTKALEDSLKCEQ